MADKTRRVNDPHVEIEVKMLQLKLEQIDLLERLKRNKKEFDKLFKKLLAINKGFKNE